MDALQSRDIPDLKRDRHVFARLLARDFAQPLTDRPIGQHVNAQRCRERRRPDMSCKCPERTALLDVVGQPSVAGLLEHSENSVEPLLSGIGQGDARGIFRSAIPDRDKEVERAVGIIDRPSIDLELSAAMARESFDAQLGVWHFARLGQPFQHFEDESFPRPACLDLGT